MKFKFLLSSLFLLALSQISAQGDLRIGQWSEHLPYNGGSTVTQSPTRVYYGTEFALISILKSDTSQVEFFSKVDGLSDVAPSWIRYHHALKTLIIGYKNGNIDLLDTNGITNINDLLQSTSIQGDKSFRHIYTNDGPVAYFSTSFGLVLLNLETGKFTSTIFTSSPVNGFTIFQDRFYVATEKGVYTYNPTSGNIIEDFSQWEKIPIPGLNPDYISESIAVFKGILYAGGNGELYRMDQDDFIPWYARDGFTLRYLSPEGSHLMAGFSCDNQCVGKVFFFTEHAFGHENGLDCAARLCLRSGHEGS